MSQKKENRRYIAKLKVASHQNSNTGVTFESRTFWVNNPEAVNQDGSENKYHQGSLTWYDKVKQKFYQVKQIKMFGPSEKDTEKGFAGTLVLDLDDSYSAKELE